MRKTMLFVVLMVFLLCVMGSITYFVAQDISLSYYKMYQQNIDPVNELHMLQLQQREMEALTLRFLITGQNDRLEVSKQDIDRVTQKFDEMLAILQAKASDDQERSWYSQIQINKHKYYDQRDMALQLVTTSSASAYAMYMNDAYIHLEHMDQDIHWLMDHRNELSREEYAAAHHRANVFLMSILVISLITVGLAISGGCYVSKSITEPLMEMTEVVQNIAAGDLTVCTLDARHNDELGQLAQDINQMAYNLKIDSKTGLYNFKYFTDELAIKLVECEFNNLACAIVLIDIDYFKHYNDTQGHVQGDYVLREFSKLLKAGTRDKDIVARYGGEEFIIYLHQADAQAGWDIAERIRDSIAHYSFLGGEQQPGGCLTASFGVASFPEHGNEVLPLIQQADAALYNAKANGRNRVEIYRSKAQA